MKALTRNGFSRKGPLVFIIMDGVGLRESHEGNAFFHAHTPNLDMLMDEYPMTSIKAHGTAVGLPSDDDMGNSEVGHNALGAGRIIEQGAKLVNGAIESGAIFSTDVWKEPDGKARQGENDPASHGTSLRRERTFAYRPSVQSH